jgi:hypothetical protein
MQRSPVQLPVQRAFATLSLSSSRRDRALSFVRGSLKPGRMGLLSPATVMKAVGRASTADDSVRLEATVLNPADTRIKHFTVITMSAYLRW